MTPRFRLQFDVEDVARYAGEYAYQDDAEVLAHGRAARKRGYYTRREFVEVCRWKTQRSAPLVARNTATEVKAATRIALDADTSDRERMRALRRLHGVDWPTASVLLHLTCPDRWPILDMRVLHALGVRGASYSYTFWEAFVANHRDLLRRARIDGRTLDRGMWQWSAEQQGSLYRPSRSRC